MIYLAYTKEDAVFVIRLAEDLAATGIDLWVDVNEIGATADWSAAQQAAIEASEGVIVVVSAGSRDTRAHAARDRPGGPGARSRCIWRSPGAHPGRSGSKGCPSPTSPGLRQRPQRPADQPDGRPRSRPPRPTLQEARPKPKAPRSQPQPEAAPPQPEAPRRSNRATAPAAALAAEGDAACWAPHRDQRRRSG